MGAALDDSPIQLVTARRIPSLRSRVAPFREAQISRVMGSPKMLCRIGGDRSSSPAKWLARMYLGLTNRSRL